MRTDYVRRRLARIFQLGDTPYVPLALGAEFRRKATSFSLNTHIPGVNQMRGSHDIALWGTKTH